MPMKRSFAEFTAGIEHKHEHKYKHQLSFGIPHAIAPTPSASTSTSSLCPAIQRSTAHIASPLPTSIRTPTLLRRCKSLPTIDQLRRGTPFIPLTAYNLRAMGDTNLPMTPDRTTSGSKKSKSTSTPSTVADDGYKMSLVKLLDPSVGEERLDRHSHIREAVADIIGASRASCVSLETAKNFTKAVSIMAMRNEATIASRLMPYLVQRERTVLGDEETFLNGNESDRNVLRSFEVDHLDWNVDKDFVQFSVPFPPTEKMPRSYFGIRNPKPDITYGFQRTAFTTSQQKALVTFEPEISGQLVSPFFVLEWKGFSGSMQLAKDQARRSGAAMVHSRREAIRRQSPDPPSDLSCLAFTCVVNVEAAHIHVHWAEDGPDGTEWLMAVVRRFHVGDPEDFIKLRRALHNILDWGLTERLRCVKTQLDEFLRQSDGVDTGGGESDGLATGVGKRKRVA